MVHRGQRLVPPESRKNSRAEKRAKKRRINNKSFNKDRFVTRKDLQPTKEELTGLDGNIYASKAEVTMANILYVRNIKFKHSVKFDTVKENGTKSYREVDFLLEKPIRVHGCDSPVWAFEVKGGYLGSRAWFQRRELRNAGVYTFVVTWLLLNFWRDYGFLKEENFREIKTSKKVNKYKQVSYRGTTYDNWMHVEMAKVLLKRGIKFEYNKLVTVTTGANKRPLKIKVQFLLQEPQKVYWIPKPVKVIFIEDELTPPKWERRKSLNENGFFSFIADVHKLNFWTNCAFLRTETILEKRTR